MPLAKTAIAPPKVSTEPTANPPDTISRLDIAGVPMDIFSYFNVPLNASEREVNKLRIISDWAKDAGTIGDALLKIRSLETHLGSPDGLDKRYQKIWEFCKMDLYSRELEKKKEALRRIF
jgi:hypothetical protein